MRKLLRKPMRKLLKKPMRKLSRRLLKCEGTGEEWDWVEMAH
jgi:hypothetical protein